MIVKKDYEIAMMGILHRLIMVALREKLFWFVFEKWANNDYFCDEYIMNSKQ